MKLTRYEIGKNEAEIGVTVSIQYYNECISQLPHDYV